MNGWMRDFIKENWKWFLGLMVAGITAFTGLRTTVNSVVQTTINLTDKVTSLETFRAVQEKQNQYIEKKLDNIDQKLDKILRR